MIRLRLSGRAVGVRVAMVVTGMAALTAAVPPGWYGDSAAVLVVAAVLASAAAIAPGGWVVLAVDLLAVALWLIPGGRSPMATWVIAVALGVLLYVHHALAGIAVIEPDVGLQRSVLIGWLRRLSSAVGLGASAAVVVGLMADSVDATISDWALPIGLAVALALAWVPLRFLLTQRSCRGSRE